MAEVVCRPHPFEISTIISDAVPIHYTTAISDAAPTHYTVTIDSFSLLAKNSVERYESGLFDAGGYKWKLVLYPNGNRSKNVKDYMSIYLAIGETSSLPLGWEVYAIFRLFLLDKNNDNSLIRQETKERRFSKLKLERGFDQFILLTTLKDGSNGYLLEDSCAFGAEVFVCKETRAGKGERLSMIEQPTSFKHAWRIENFSKLRTECEESEIFDIGGQKWKIQLYPRGKGLGAGTHLSLYLALADSTDLASGSKVLVDFTLRILGQVRDRTAEIFGKARFWYSGGDRERGWTRYISLQYFCLPYNGLLVKDSCILEAEVNVLGIAEAFEC